MLFLAFYLLGEFLGIEVTSVGWLYPIGVAIVVYLVAKPVEQAEAFWLILLGSFSGALLAVFLLLLSVALNSRLVEELGMLMFSIGPIEGAIIFSEIRTSYQ